MKALWRGLRAFGSFWWDFLVGDTPELFVAVLVIVTLALLLRHHRDIALILLPVIAVLFLLASTLRGRQQDGTRSKS
jgi:uncharacterized membrane protein